MTRLLYTSSMTHPPSSLETERHPGCAAGRHARRSFELSAWLAVCAAVYVTALYLVRRHPGWSPGSRAALGLAPILPGLLYLRSGLRLLREMDELQRRIRLEALLFAALGTVIVGTVINVLNLQGLGGAWPREGLQVGGAYMTMFLLWCAGFTLSNLRYR